MFYYLKSYKLKHVEGYTIILKLNYIDASIFEIKHKHPFLNKYLISPQFGLG